MRFIKTAFNKVWTARHQWLLPVILIVLFMVQTQVFNMWLGIQSSLSQQRLLSSFAVGMFAFGPAMVLKRRGRYIWLTIAAFLVELLFLAQFVYYMSFETFIRGSAIRYVSYVGTVSDSIKVQLNPLLIFFILMLPIIGLWYWFMERGKSQPRYQLRTRLIALVGILLITFIAFMGMLSIERKKHGGLRELLNVPYDNSTMVAKVGVHMYSILDTYRYFATPRGITEAEKQYVEDWNNNRPAPQAPGVGFGSAQGKNVILVQLESFDTFAIGRSIEGQEITPNINKLITESMYYSNYHDQVGTGRTADGEFGTQNSLLPTMDRVAFFEYATHDYYALPEILKEKGYETAVFHGDVPSFWNRNVAYPYMGWDTYYSLDRFKINRPVGWGLSDEDLVRQSVPYMTQLKQPFYASVATVTSHVPFHLPDDLKPLKITKPLGISQQQEDYIQTLAYTDKQVGLLIDELKKTGLYDKSIMALLGDHRAFITNQNDTKFAQFLGLSKFDALSYFEDGEYVPLIVHVPGSGIKGEVTTPASHLDYAPTILGLLGIQKPTTMLGQDLLAQHSPVAIQRNSAGSIEVIETPEVFYINSGDGEFGSGTCYQASTRKQIDLSTCKAVYDEQSALAKVSDIVVRGDALYLLK
jgi:phosphoglycerol transferase MdoB-like AlkP superfamily enzyme